MKATDQEQLRQLYPELTNEFADKMEQLLLSLCRQQQHRVRPHTAPRLALILLTIIVLLSATAYAITRPKILNWLLHRSPASEALLTSAQEISAEGTADSITVRITGVIYDGISLSFSYEIENSNPAEPALVVLDQPILLNGTPVDLVYTRAAAEHPQMIPSPHLDVPPVRRNPVSGGGDTHHFDRLSGEVQCEITCRVYRPRLGFAVVDDMLNTADNPDIQDVLATLRTFTNTRIDDSTCFDPIRWAAQGFTAIEHSGSPLLGLETEILEGRLVETAVIPLSFTFDADNAVIYDFSFPADTIRPDCTVQVRNFVLTSLSTIADVYLVPAENTQQAAKALAHQHGTAVLTDGQGKPVIYCDMDWLSSDQPHIQQLRSGQWVCRYSISMPGLLEFPETICFCTEAGPLFSFDLQKGDK